LRCGGDIKVQRCDLWVCFCCGVVPAAQHVVDCAQIRPDLSIVPFWPAFVGVVKAVEPLPQQFSGGRRGWLAGAKAGDDEANLKILRYGK
jgi:hypothetical protein